MKVPYGKGVLRLAFAELMNQVPPSRSSKQEVDKLLADLRKILSNELEINREIAVRNKLTVSQLISSSDYKKKREEFLSNLYYESVEKLQRILNCNEKQAWAFLLAFTGMLD